MTGTSWRAMFSSTQIYPIRFLSFLRCSKYCPCSPFSRALFLFLDVKYLLPALTQFLHIPFYYNHVKLSNVLFKCITAVFKKISCAHLKRIVRRFKVGLLLYRINVFHLFSLGSFSKKCKAQSGARAMGSQRRYKLCEFYWVEGEYCSRRQNVTKDVESNGVDWIAFTPSEKDLLRSKLSLPYGQSSM